MDIKTFEAFSMKDVIKSVKQTLGSDAVILSTKEKASPNGKGTVYEVTAAASSSARKTGTSHATQHLQQMNNGPAPDFDAINVRLTAIAEQIPTKRHLTNMDAGIHELKLLLLEALRLKENSQFEDASPALANIMTQLKVMGVNESSIIELVKHLRSLPPPEGKTPEDEYYRGQAIRWMMKRIKIAPKWVVMKGTTAYQVVIGPTGVGKSSTIAKLAAHYKMKERANVMVVSMDNHRIAAADQMRVFCKIIGVPFATASSPEEIAAIVAAKRDLELVLIDTGGISPKNPSQIEQLANMKSSSMPFDFHLCLSITDKEQQMDAAIRAFSVIGLNSIVFSKLDESWSFGEIYNLSKKWGLPLSFFAIGQDIPDDIERATRERVIEKLFGL
jgi:flagellar biosynthesis protein FlhF